MTYPATHLEVVRAALLADPTLRGGFTLTRREDGAAVVERRDPTDERASRAIVGALRARGLRLERGAPGQAIVTPG